MSSLTPEQIKVGDKLKYFHYTSYNEKLNYNLTVVNKKAKSIYCQIDDTNRVLILKWYPSKKSWFAEAPLGFESSLLE